MPKGIPNKPSPPPSAPAETSPAPLIILQPQADGTRIDAYGLDHATVVDELRRALLHLVARQSGVTIISEVVSRQAAVVATPALPASKPKVPAPSPNGTGQKKTRSPYLGPRRELDVRNAPELAHLRDGYDDEPDLREDLAAALDSIEV